MTFSGDTIRYDTIEALSSTRSHEKRN